jgi:hypothetical protein
MACIERRPRCGDAVAGSQSDKTPLGKIGSIIGSIVGLVGIITTVLAIYGKIAVVKGVLTIGGVAIAGAAGAGAISAAAAAVAVIIIIGMYAADRCLRGEGSSECIAGVVREIVQSFNSALDELFPFTAMHDRVDVVVKSAYWDVVESNFAKVFCTDHAIPQRSEIMRSYYFTPQVCRAAQAAVAGGIAGGVAGVLIGVAVAAAIGCATIILCLFALLIAALIAAAAVLIGALAGGQIAKATTPEADPTDSSGGTIATGALISIRGNMKRRDEDEGANVLWWAETTSPHGMISSGVTQPFTYCDLDMELPTDSCPRAPSPIR